MSVRNVLFAASFVALGAVATASFDWSAPAAAQSNRFWYENQVSPAALNEDTRVDLGTFKRLSKALSPSVVNINIARKSGSKRMQQFMRRHYGQIPPEYMNRGLGSGFIIHEDGWILTNNHVVEGADRIQVRLHNDHTYSAEIVGADGKTDVALLKIEPKEELVPAPLGKSAKLEAGEWVLAIGNPFGLNHTVTAGIVSALGRKDVNPDGKQLPYANFIQTDASINPGNSGGPLFNIKGEVIGINTAINRAGQGIGFAIPIDMVKTLLPDLRHGQVRRSWLGVMIQPVDQTIADSLGLKSTKGALVAEVVSNGPADDAGIAPGDVITRFNGKPVATSRDLPWLASTAGIGKRVSLTVMRDGRERIVGVTMGELPDERGLSKASRRPHRRKAVGATPGGFGMTVQKRDGKLTVTEVESGGPAAEAGVEVGDVVVKLSNKPVNTVQDFTARAAEVETGRVVMMLVLRGDRKLFKAFTRK